MKLNSWLNAASGTKDQQMQNLQEQINQLQQNLSKIQNSSSVITHRHSNLYEETPFKAVNKSDYIQTEKSFVQPTNKDESKETFGTEVPLVQTIDDTDNAMKLSRDLQYDL